MGPLIGPGCGSLCRPPCPSGTSSFHWAAGCAPALSSGPDYLAGRPARTSFRRPTQSESVAPRFTGSVPPCRCRGGVQATRADQVQALVGRGPASPNAACLVGGAVVRVTGPGRGVGLLSRCTCRRTPVPWTKPLRGDQGEIRRREARVQRGVIIPLRLPLGASCSVPGFPR
jgi:hypothetical protein